MFYLVTHSYKHTQIANLTIKIKRENDKANKENSWTNLYIDLKELNGVQ